MSKDYYLIEKNLSKVLCGKYTNFLDPNELRIVCSKLKGVNYNIYYPYKESDKAIIYGDELPRIRVIEIISYDILTHREIMGSLYGFNIDSEMFGDIVISDGHYYIMVMDSIFDLFMREFNSVGNHYISLKEVDISTISNYERKYESLEFFVSSLRIDVIIARIIGSSRDSVKKLFTIGDVILNYNVCNKVSYILNEGDIFSIRRYGKYKFGGVIKTSKKGHYVIKIYKYVN